MHEIKFQYFSDIHTECYENNLKKLSRYQEKKKSFMYKGENIKKDFNKVFTVYLES